MKRQIRWMMTFCALLAVLTLVGCRGKTTGEPTASPVPSASSGPEESGKPSGGLPPETTDSVPAETEPAETEPAETESTVLTVDGGEIPAERRHSGLGYSILCPEEGVTVTQWEGGETYELAEARGTYLAVSQIGGSNISEAAAGLQFEYDIQDDPTGYIFGSEGYAGVRMTQTAGGLSVEYILLQQNNTIYLVERAVFTGGENFTGLLQAMLDSFTVE